MLMHTARPLLLLLFSYPAFLLLFYFNTFVYKIVVAVSMRLWADVYFDGTQAQYKNNASEEHGVKIGQRTENILR